MNTYLLVAATENGTFCHDVFDADSFSVAEAISAYATDIRDEMGIADLGITWIAAFECKDGIHRLIARSTNP